MPMTFSLNIWLLYKHLLLFMQEMAVMEVIRRNESLMFLQGEGLMISA